MTPHRVDHSCCEAIKHIKELLELMSNEPDSYIILSEIYHKLKMIVDD